jgi:flagellar hook-length control protein FliK
MNLNLTADFSVATARVIAPQATTQAAKSLEQLLRGDASETQSKTDGLNVHKADSFEVKLNEAKQMIKYLSQDVKTAIEDYKSPFTRVKVQLNPQKLGEVDLTVVQRGKNLHVSLSSNNAAINTLAMNANELRAQLSNSGINNATLNFNNQDGSSSQAGQQEQHRQREQRAHDEYSYFENEEQSEEILSSLEIVVPNYA